MAKNKKQILDILSWIGIGIISIVTFMLYSDFKTLTLLGNTYYYIESNPSTVNYMIIGVIASIVLIVVNKVMGSKK